MPDHPLVCLRVPDRDSDSVHVGPGQAGPRLVPAERLHILTRIRGESCTITIEIVMFLESNRTLTLVNGEVRRSLETKSLASSNNQAKWHIAGFTAHTEMGMGGSESRPGFTLLVTSRILGSGYLLVGIGQRFCQNEQSLQDSTLSVTCRIVLVDRWCRAYICWSPVTEAVLKIKYQKTTIKEFPDDTHPPLIIIVDRNDMVGISVHI